MPRRHSWIHCGSSSGSGCDHCGRRTAYRRSSWAAPRGLGGKYIGIIERGEKNASFEAIEKLSKALNVESYELFVPLNRRADGVGRQVKALLGDRGRIDVSNVEEFLKAMAFALRKLEKAAKSG